MNTITSVLAAILVISFILIITLSIFVIMCVPIIIASVSLFYHWFVTDIISNRILPC